jgi:hypothetical protein
MADNVSVTPGTGSSIATDDIGGIQHQRVKLTLGADGVSDGDVSSSNPMPVTGSLTVDLGANNDVTVTSGTITIGNAAGASAVNIQDGGNSITVDNAALSVVGGGVEASALRVTLATDSTGVLSVDDNGGSLTVDGTVTINAIPTGTNTIGSVKLTDGTTVATVRELGTNDALNVSIVDGSGNQITSFGGGTQYTEDAAAAADPVGTAPILVRTDTPAATVSANGDNIAQRGSNFGAAYTTQLRSDGSFCAPPDRVSNDDVATGGVYGIPGMFIRNDTVTGDLVSANGDYCAMRGNTHGAIYIQPVGTDGTKVDLNTQLPPVVVNDAAAGGTLSGITMFGVRSDTLTGDLVNAVGDYIALRLSTHGGLYTQPINSTGTKIDLDSYLAATTQEDAPAAANPTGHPTIMVRADTPSTLTTANGNYVAQRCTNYGAGYTQLVTSSGSFIDSVGGGTEYTEDAAAAADPLGKATILVRKDTPATITSTDGDNVAQRGTNYGAAYVQVVSSTGSFVDSFGGGTEYTEAAAAAANPVGGATILVATSTPGLETTDGNNVAQRGTRYGAAYTQLVTSTGTFIDSVGGGTEFAEDSAHTTGALGKLCLAVRNDTDSQQTSANGDYAALNTDAYNHLRVTNPLDGPGSVDTFGHLITGRRNNQIDIQFYRDTPANLLTITGTDGTATQTLGGVVFSSTNTAGGDIKGVTAATTLYSSGGEIYTQFTAAFSTGLAGSFQRIGLYDANNGVFIGNEATSFGITTRTGGVDTSVAKASWNVDTLTGAAGSKFTRAGVPEAINLTFANVYRIRFGWLGEAPIVFEVLSPDGQWVVFHKILQPNTTSAPSIQTPELPMTCEVNKSGAAGSTITITTYCWGAGCTLSQQKLNAALTSTTLTEVVRSVIAGESTSVAGTFVNAKVSAAGAVQTSGAVTDVIPGTGATNLGKAEDAAHSSGDVGVMGLAVRTDTPASLAGTTGDYAPLQLNASGYARVEQATTLFYNDSTSNQTNGTTLTGTTRDTGFAAGTICPWNYFNVTVYNSHAATLKIQMSNDNSTWFDATPTINILAGTVNTLSAPVVTRYYRLLHVQGGSSSTTFCANSSYTVN